MSCWSVNIIYLKAFIMIQPFPWTNFPSQRTTQYQKVWEKLDHFFVVSKQNNFKSVQFLGYYYFLLNYAYLSAMVTSSLWKDP